MELSITTCFFCLYNAHYKLHGHAVQFDKTILTSFKKGEIKWGY